MWHSSLLYVYSLREVLRCSFHLLGQCEKPLKREASIGIELYESVVVPILENQRVMICSYQYTNDAALTPEEAVDYWYNNPQYKEGNLEHKFSNGDYFNMLTLITDSTEQRKIVERAYREMVSGSGYQTNAFNAYIANRKAIYMLEDGLVDTEILKPFIDTLKNTCDRKEYINLDYGEEYWIINRKQLVANQALMYLKENDLDKSRTLISMLPNSESIKTEIGKYYDLIDYIMNLENTKYPENDRKRGEEALNAIRMKKDMNSVVLNSELYSYFGLEPLEVMTKYVDSLPDDNPKKWYFKGMLLSRFDFVGHEEDFLAKADTNRISIVKAYQNGLRAENLTIENLRKYRAVTIDEHVPDEYLCLLIVLHMTL